MLLVKMAIKSVYTNNFQLLYILHASKTFNSFKNWETYGNTCHSALLSDTKVTKRVLLKKY